MVNLTPTQCLSCCLLPVEALAASPERPWSVGSKTLGVAKEASVVAPEVNVEAEERLEAVPFLVNAKLEAVQLWAGVVAEVAGNRGDLHKTTSSA